MKNGFVARRTLALFLACVLAFLPVAAHAGLPDILALLTTITSTLQNGVGQVLSGIQTIDTTVRDFEHQVVWPVTLINQTRAEVSQLRAQFSTLANQIQSIPASSATLTRLACSVARKFGVTGLSRDWFASMVLAASILTWPVMPSASPSSAPI